MGRLSPVIEEILVPPPLGGHAKKMSGAANSKPDISTRSTRQNHPAHASYERPSTAPPQWDHTKRQFIENKMLQKQNITEYTDALETTKW
ncbi:hypothetical protein CDAR_312651 [Caerostris darwini]|uniref:Uncharacterized protein n=1 Tax=Caerostris darwini TaxID=1538125 RepID=A0AAV4MCJ9_9ARAC|nr:hypothetical protein CDAR_312651 [Caerostris darwini]